MKLRISRQQGRDAKTGIRGRMWKFMRYQVGVWGHVKELERRRRG
jgi:hypothetical protein